MARTGEANAIEWDIGSWYRWPGIPVRKHYKFTEDTLSQVSTGPDMTLDVGRR